MRSGSRPAARFRHTVEAVRGWLEVSRRPPGVELRPWLRFVRCRLVCLLRGHVAPALLHRQDPAGLRTRLELREVCGRCGEEFDVKVNVSQFPRQRA